MKEYFPILFENITPLPYIRRCNMSAFNVIIDSNLAQSSLPFTSVLLPLLVTFLEKKPELHFYQFLYHGVASTYPSRYTVLVCMLYTVHCRCGLFSLGTTVGCCQLVYTPGTAAPL